MNEEITRIDLEQASRGSTDWAALEGLSDVQIDARALLDPDTLLPNARDLGLDGAKTDKQSTVQFVIYKVKGGNFSWSLVAADGTLFAVSPDHFTTKALALASVRKMLLAISEIDDIAA
jgi:uncharacterized protein YegP (UPF0339 family)